jgi:DNA-binding CsgD family transcriptional regulator
MDSQFILRCFHAPLFRLVVPRTVAMLGRWSRADLVVDDRSVSRRHAEIRICGARLLVTDLESRNGTFVSELRIHRAEVAHGQMVRFGSVPFEVEVSDRAEPAQDEETDEAGLKMRPRANASLARVEGLSEAQGKVFQMLLTGNAEKAIAEVLELSQHTVHNHVKAILRRFAVHSRVELLAKALHGKGNRRLRAAGLVRAIQTAQAMPATRG